MWCVVGGVGGWVGEQLLVPGPTQHEALLRPCPPKPRCFNNWWWCMAPNLATGGAWRPTWQLVVHGGCAFLFFPVSYMDALSVLIWSSRASRQQGGNQWCKSRRLFR
jgi:hypothetical protein